jgi:hypothetical protein
VSGDPAGDDERRELPEAGRALARRACLVTIRLESDRNPPVLMKSPRKAPIEHSPKGVYGARSEN